MSVDQWIRASRRRSSSGDSAAAAELFADDAYWRDLVAFTWNIKTVEGPAGVRDLLDATLANVQPSGWTTERAADHGRRRDRRLARVRDRRRAAARAPAAA